MIELDKDLVLNYAFNLLTDNFIYHGTGNRKAIGIRFKSTGKVSPYLEATLPLNPYWVYLAWNEWFQWTVLGYIMIAVRRYWSSKYGLSITVHVVLATICSALTMTLGFSAKEHLGWNFYQVNFHNKIATAMMFIAPVTYIMGLITLLTMKYYGNNAHWTNKKEVSRQLSLIHRILGYGLMVHASVVTLTGVFVFKERYDAIDPLVGWVNFAVSIFVTILSEVLYRRWLKTNRAVLETPKKNFLPEMTYDEIMHQVYNKDRNLVILDNLVLNFGEFHHYHPGGRFMLMKNRGRDISKFFYGGYRLVNDKDDMNIPHTHSPTATKVAQEMVIAFLKDQKDVKETIAVISSKIRIASSTQIMVLEELTGETCKFFKRWQPDIKKLG